MLVDKSDTGLSAPGEHLELLVGRHMGLEKVAEHLGNKVTDIIG